MVLKLANIWGFLGGSPQGTSGNPCGILWDILWGILWGILWRILGDLLRDPWRILWGILWGIQGTRIPRDCGMTSLGLLGNLGGPWLLFGALGMSQGTSERWLRTALGGPSQELSVAEYSRVAQSDLRTPTPGSLRISPRPQMDGRRLGKGPRRVFVRFYIRKHSQNIAKINPNQSQKTVKIFGNQWKSGLADR